MDVINVWNHDVPVENVVKEFECIDAALESWHKFLPANEQAVDVFLV